MAKIRFSVFAILLLVLSTGCASSTKSIYEDTLLSCQGASPNLNEIRHEFSDTAGKVYCYAGDRIPALDGGDDPHQFYFHMFVDDDPGPYQLSSIESIKDSIGTSDGYTTIRIPNTRWQPPSVVDDFVSAEYRSTVELKTGIPSVSYVVMAKVGKTLFTVDTIDYGASIGRELLPVGDAMWSEANRAIDLLITRYQSLNE